MTKQIEMQLGKNGLTQGFIEDIKKRTDKFSNADIKISVLRSARENKEDVRKYADQLKEKLGDKYTYKVLGFSIFLKKWRKARV
ncbi:MAG: RNA-binding protein [Candidatus Pacearchaeota archaeon]